MTKRIADVDVVHVQTGDTLESVATANGLTWQQLARFNWGTEDQKEINRCLREIVGCTKRTADGKSYKFHSSDDPGLLYVPKPLQLPGLALNRPYVLRVSRPKLHGRVTIQTVDYFGHPLPNVKLHLNPIKRGAPMDCETNDKGVFASSKVESGDYFVEERDGSATFFYEKLDKRNGANADDPFGQLEPARFTTQTHFDTIISVVAGPVPTAAEEEERRLKSNTYYRTPRQIPLPALGSETEGVTQRSWETSADNLLLAAGWVNAYEKINWANLMLNVLPGWLETYYPSVVSRGYYLVVLDAAGRELKVWDILGSNPVTAQMKPDKQLRGLYGMYALLQNENGPYFVDMATRSTIIDILNEAEDQGIESLLVDPAPYIDYVNSHSGRVEVVCMAPSADALGTIALHGGTGRLEDYGRSAAINGKIHSRNVAVCKNMRVMYDAYIRGYVKRVLETKDHEELRELGPPLQFHEMPLPAMVTRDQVVELFNAQFTNNELDAWSVIGQHLDDLAGRKSQGLPYFRFKVKYKRDNKLEKDWKSKGYDKEVTPGFNKLGLAVAVEVEVETYMDVQLTDERVLILRKDDASTKVAASLRGETGERDWGQPGDKAAYTRNGTRVDLAFKQSLTNPEKTSVSLRMGPYAFDQDSMGKTKLSVEMEPGVWLDAEYSVPSAEMGVGFTWKFKDIAAEMKKQAKAKLPVNEPLMRWAEELESVEVQGLVGFLGLREETALAVVSNAPGFFQRRSPEDLFSPELQWNDLVSHELVHLVTLGWRQDVWNMKYEPETAANLPASLKKTRGEWEAAEMVAIVQLGFYAYEDYAKLYNKMKAKHADYVH